ALDRIGKFLCLWRQGDEHAWVRLPLASANVYVLERLLAEQLAGRPDTFAAGEELGRIIFERRPGKTWALVGGLCTVVFLGLTALAIAEAQDPLTRVSVAALFFSAASVSGLWVVHTLRSVFRCHERGVYKSGLFGPRTLRYEDVE